MKIDSENTLAKEGLLKINAKKEAYISEKKKVKNPKSTNLLRKDTVKLSDNNSGSVSGDNDVMSLEHRFRSRQRNPLHQFHSIDNTLQQENLEELTGLKGALILIVRIIFDIFGGLFGYGTISPTYYNYM